jgi:hypothetical protein
MLALSLRKQVIEREFLFGVEVGPDDNFLGCVGQDDNFLGCVG